MLVCRAYERGVEQVHCFGLPGPALKEHLNVVYEPTRHNVAKLIP